MKAIVQGRFGPPDVLQLVDTDLPEVRADDVLVRVHAAAINPADWHILRGDPLVGRLMGVGLTIEVPLTLLVEVPQSTVTIALESGP
jgi:NADPH:quinone reductase-like Zn-dependent oxidoreductase